jgi:hypothetical protein
MSRLIIFLFTFSSNEHRSWESRVAGMLMNQPVRIHCADIPVLSPVSAQHFINSEHTYRHRCCPAAVPPQWSSMRWSSTEVWYPIVRGYHILTTSSTRDTQQSSADSVVRWCPMTPKSASSSDLARELGSSQGCKITPTCQGVLKIYNFIRLPTVADQLLYGSTLASVKIRHGVLTPLGASDSPRPSIREDQKGGSAAGVGKRVSSP